MQSKEITVDAKTIIFVRHQDTLVNFCYKCESLDACLLVNHARMAEQVWIKPLAEASD